MLAAGAGAAVKLVRMGQARSTARSIGNCLQGGSQRECCKEVASSSSSSSSNAVRVVKGVLSVVEPEILQSPPEHPSCNNSCMQRKRKYYAGSKNYSLHYLRKRSRCGTGYRKIPPPQKQSVELQGIQRDQLPCTIAS